MSFFPQFNTNPSIITGRVGLIEQFRSATLSTQIYDGPAPGPFNVSAAQFLRHQVLRLDPDGGTIAQRVINLPEVADIVSSLESPQVGMLRQLHVQNAGSSDVLVVNLPASMTFVGVTLNLPANHSIWLVLRIDSITTGSESGTLYALAVDNTSIPPSSTDPLPDNVVTVSKDFTADYDNIRDALAQAATFAPIPAMVMVFPGVYTEDNSAGRITVPENVSLIGFGEPPQSIVIPSTPANGLFEMSQFSVIKGFRFQGAAGTPHAAEFIFFDGSGGGRCLVKTVVLLNSAEGIIVDGSGTMTILEMFCNNVAPSSFTGPALWVRNGAEVSLVNGSVLGSAGALVGEGVRVEGNGTSLTWGTGRADFCTTALVVDDRAFIQMGDVAFRDNTTALQLDNTTNGQQTINAAGIIMRDNTTDVNIQASSSNTEIYLTGEVNVTRITNPNNLQIFGNVFSEHNGEPALDILGELHVGTPEFPTEATIGGGDSYTNQVIYIWDDDVASNPSILTDVTSTFASNTGSTTTIWPGASQNNALIVGAPRKFHGWKVKIPINGTVFTNSADPLDVEMQYLASAGTEPDDLGATWVQFQLFTTDADAPYMPYANQILRRNSAVAVTNEHIRFGPETSGSGWEANTFTAVGVATPYYWVRLVVTNPGGVTSGSNPVLEQIKVHPSRTEINTDGYVEYFGDARSIKDIGWDYGQVEPPSSNTPANFDIDYSANISLGRAENRFNNGALDRAAFARFLPHNIDTSFAIRLTLQWVIINFGGGGLPATLTWTIRTGVTTTGDTVGALPETVYTENITINGGDPADTIRETIFYLDVTTLVATRSASAGDMFYVAIERDGPGDSFTGDVAIVQMQGDYVAWTEGGNLATF